MYIPADLPVCQPTCSFDVFLPTSHEHPHMPPSTGLYTRFIFCSAYTQAYAFLPAKINDLPVDSTTRLHTHTGTCSSACQFFFSLRFNLRTYLWTHMLVHVPKRPTYPKIYVPAHFDPFLQANYEDLPVDSTARPHTHRCNRFSSYLFILKLTFRQTTSTDLSTHILHYISTPPSHQFISLHVHFNFSRQCKSSGLPINSSAGPRTQRRTRKWTYHFILMAHFRLITKTYVSNQLVVYLSMDAPFPKTTCSFPCFHSG